MGWDDLLKVPFFLNFVPLPKLLLYQVTLFERSKETPGGN